MQGEREKSLDNLHITALFVGVLRRLDEGRSVIMLASVQEGSSCEKLGIRGKNRWQQVQEERKNVRYIYWENNNFRCTNFFDLNSFYYVSKKKRRR
jgi:hypothetical protein